MYASVVTSSLLGCKSKKSKRSPFITGTKANMIVFMSKSDLGNTTLLLIHFGCWSVYYNSFIIFS